MTGKTHLSDLSNEERTLIVGLPYRVGMWVSQSEDDGGESDDEREAAALEKTLHGLAKAEKVPVFVREVLGETLAHQNLWPEWAEDTFRILPDCERAVKILDEKCSKSDRNNFKKALKRIAVSVAGAYGEYGDFDGDSDKGMIGRFISKIKGSQGKAEDFMNISPGEEDALRNLSAALRTDDD